MLIDRQPKGRRAAPPGVWLAILAIAGQVFLPFLLAFEIAWAAPQAEGDAAVPICTGIHADAVPAPPDKGRTGHHTRPGGCPICQVLAACQAFTQPTPITLPSPIISTVISPSSVPSRPQAFLAAASYQSRAPPSNV